LSFHFQTFTEKNSLNLTYSFASDVAKQEKKKDTKKKRVKKLSIDFVD
jgi:hypothetical protein